MGMSETEALDRSRKLLEQSERSVDHVAALILRDKPDASAEEIGGLFDAYGGASWNPVRASGIDFSAWGRWEAWEHCEYRDGRAEPTGDWVAWDASTGVPGLQRGFSQKSVKGARWQAESLAVYMNEGRATRVVSLLGASASAMSYQDVRALIEKRIDADTRAAMQGELSAQ